MENLWAVLFEMGWHIHWRAPDTKTGKLKGQKEQNQQRYRRVGQPGLRHARRSSNASKASTVL
jgi:hypothetical protein